MISIAGHFLAALLGALITSALTEASLVDLTASVSELRGSPMKIAIASSTLVPYFASLNVRTTNVANINEWAAAWYKGAYPDHMGFCTSTEVVTYLHNLYRGGKNGFVITDDFMPSGSLTLKGFPISKAAPPGFRSRFDILVQDTRMKGQLADLHRQYIRDADQDVGLDDVPVDEDAHLAMRIGNAIFYGVVFILTGVLCWRHGIRAHQAVSLNILSWKGKTYTVPEEVGDLSLGCSNSSSLVWQI